MIKTPEGVCMASFLATKRELSTPETSKPRKPRPTSGVSRYLKSLLPSKSSDDLIRRYNSVTAKQKSLPPQPKQQTTRSPARKPKKENLLLAEDIMRKIQREKEKFVRKEEGMQMQHTNKRYSIVKLKEITNQGDPKEGEKRREVRKVRLNIDPVNDRVLVQNSSKQQTHFLTHQEQTQLHQSLPFELQLKHQLIEAIQQNLEVIQEERTQTDYLKSDSLPSDHQGTSSLVSGQQTSVNVQPRVSSHQPQPPLPSHSPIRDYSNSGWIPQNEIPLATKTGQPVVKKLFLSELMEIHMEQYENEKQQSEDQLFVEEKEDQIVYQSVEGHIQSMSLDRLSSIPFEDSLKSCQLHSVHLLSKDEVHHSSPLNQQKPASVVACSIDLPIPQSTPTPIKFSLKIVRKTVQTGCHTPELDEYKTRSQVLPSILNFLTAPIPDLKQFHVLDAKASRIPIMYTQSSRKIQPDIDFYTTRFTEKGPKGISLSRKSQDRLRLQERRSTRRQHTPEAHNFARIKKSVVKKTPRTPIANLGHKVVLILREDKRPGIRVTSEKSREESNSLKRKL